MASVVAVNAPNLGQVQLSSPATQDTANDYPSVSRVEETIVHYETRPCDLECYDGKWKIFQPPLPIIPEGMDTGTYLVEFNRQHRDMTFLDKERKPSDTVEDKTDSNQKEIDQLRRFEAELLFIAHNPKVQHLVLSFYDCGNLQNAHSKNTYPQTHTSYMDTIVVEEKPVSAPTYLAELLLNVDAEMKSLGKQLSVIHNEPTLHDYFVEQGLLEKLQVHTILPTALVNYIPGTPVEEPNNQWTPEGHYF